VLVGDHDDRRPALVQLLDQRHDLAAGGAVEVAGRLVGQDDRRPSDERAGDRDPLALPAREVGGARPEPVGEPDRGQRGGGQLAPLGGGDARVEQPVGDVLEQGRVLGQEEELEDEADPGRPHRGELAVAHPCDVEAGDRHPPGAGAFERAHQVQQRRFPRARGPDDRDQLAFPDAEANPAQGQHRRVGPVALRHRFQLQHRHRNAVTRNELGSQRRRTAAHDAGTTIR
jgi:hypothetical protein